MKEPYDKKRDGVEPDHALAHAQLTVRREWAAGVSGFEHWHKAVIDPEPLVLYDLNGEKLFYDFTVRLDESVVGTVRASANQILGSPVVSIEMGQRRWDPYRAEREAQKLAQHQYPQTDIKSTSFVCFGYPKVGVKVDFAGETDRSVIYDASDLSLVPRFGPDELEGFTAWSFYETTAEPRMEKNLRRWELADRELEAVRSRTDNIFNAAFSDLEADRLRTSLLLESKYAFIPLYSSRVLKYGPRCTPHDCFMLYAQQTNVFCAVATGQMILDFHRWPYTQDQIAAAMNTGASGTSNPDQVAGYESLTNNSFDATYDTSADWSEAKAEIDANRPVKSGVPGHARACAGWKRQNIFLIDQPPKRWLQIYDPWPWNADICQGGAVVWEDWDAVTHTNFIYVRHA